MKNILSNIALAIILCASTFAQKAVTTASNAQLADDAVKQLLEVRAKVTKAERSAVYPASARVSDLEVENNIRSRVHMGAMDIIDNFAGTIYKHHPSQQEICTGVRLLDAAVKRHLEKSLSPNASINQKSFAVGEFLRQRPEIEIIYTSIGTCAALQPWIEKPAVIAKK